jgi:hypothetical protein
MMGQGFGDALAKDWFERVVKPILVLGAVIGIFWTAYCLTFPNSPPKKLLTIDGCDIFSFEVKGTTHYFAKCGNGRVAVTNGETGEILITK